MQIEGGGNLLEGIVFNIQKYSVHDGPGIRTTIFLKGCPLECMWCHNPESQKTNIEITQDANKCSLCGECERRCPEGCIDIDNKRFIYDRQLCSKCGVCIDYCIQGARELVGKIYSVNDILREIEKDNIFYETSSGGVTFSGGEAMMQIDFLENVIKACYEKGISVAVDTSGYTSFDNFNRIIDYVDLFLYDLKIVDDTKHKKYIGKSNKIIIDNLKKLSNKGANINIRIPLIDEINTDEKNIMDTIDIIKELNIKNVNLLPYHNIGRDKYKRLDRTYDEERMSKPSDEKLEQIKFLFEKSNFNVKIGG